MVSLNERMDGSFLTKCVAKNGGQYLKVHEVATYFGVKSKVIYRLIKSGHLAKTSKKDGLGNPMIRLADIHLLKIDALNTASMEDAAQHVKLDDVAKRLGLSPADASDLLEAKGIKTVDDVSISECRSASKKPIVIYEDDLNILLGAIRQEAEAHRRQEEARGRAVPPPSVATLATSNPQVVKVVSVPQPVPKERDTNIPAEVLSGISPFEYIERFISEKAAKEQLGIGDVELRSMMDKDEIQFLIHRPSGHLMILESSIKSILDAVPSDIHLSKGDKLAIYRIMRRSGKTASQVVADALKSLEKN